MEAVAPPTTYEAFRRVDIRVGRIVRAEDFAAARRPAYRLWIDFGSLGVKTASAQITALYARPALVGRQVLAVVNFPPKQVADFLSEVLVLGVVADAERVVLLAPEREAPLGARVA